MTMDDKVHIERSGNLFNGDRDDWNRLTARWQQLHTELLEVSVRFSEYQSPPENGDTWDHLVSEYVRVKKLVEGLVDESIGINTNLCGSGGRPLARKSGLSPAWVYRRSTAWREKNISGSQENSHD